MCIVEPNSDDEKELRMGEQKSSKGDIRGRKYLFDLASVAVPVSFCKTAVAPIDRVKLLLQVQDGSSWIKAHNRYQGIADILTRIPKEQGFLSLWRGNLANLLRYIPTQTLNFGFKNAYRNFFLQGLDRKRHFWKFCASNLLSGGAAGVTAHIFVYPLDFARTRLAADIGKIGKRQFNGIVHCLATIAKSDGPIGLYRGWLMSLQGVAIYRAAYFGTFDTAKSLFGNDDRLNFFTAWGIALAVTVSSGMASYPWDTVRRRMMMQSGRTDILYRNMLDCWTKMAAREGVGAFYKGALSNSLRCSGSALILVIYEEIQKYTDII